MIRTRFAPSPTGFLHVGGARTALFSYLAAHQAKGEFVLRIEDTDLERSTPESVDTIIQGMHWLGLNYYVGPYYQSKRFERYHAVAEQLLKEGKAYRCICSKERLETLRNEQMAKGQKPRYDGCCRNKTDIPPTVQHVVRFKNPESGTVSWNDLVKGTISFQNTELDDLIILRSDTSPTYNFTVVVDDYDMDITLVVRGDDHVNNTPRQINILEALGKPIPQYAHVSMILGPDGKRLSKRHGAESVLQYRDQGFLPEAVINYLLRLGFAHGDKELFSNDEMLELFDLKKVSASPATFDVNKLKWLNQYYMKILPMNKIMPHLYPQFEALNITVEIGPSLAKVYPLLAERTQTLKELAAAACYFYSDSYPEDDAAISKYITHTTCPALTLLHKKLKEIKVFSAENIHAAIKATSLELDLPMSKVGMPFRVAITGGTQSPSIDVTAELIGKERCLTRLAALS